MPKTIPTKKAKKTVTEVKEIEKKKVETAKINYINATGRRKTSTAQVRMIEGKGDFTVNGIPGDDFFKHIGANTKQLFEKPFIAVGRRNKFDGIIKVIGGGVHSQMGAIVHAVSRALDKYNPEEFHHILKKHELLTRDSRMKESRHFGLMGARKKKSSPKR